MDVVEQLVRSFANRTTQNGHVVLVTEHHPALVAAFQHLGWSDPYLDPTLLPVPDPKPIEKVPAAAPKGR